MQPGAFWLLGDHRLFCRHALKAESYTQLLNYGEWGRAEAVDLVSGPALHIEGHVSGRGKTTPSRVQCSRRPRGILRGPETSASGTKTRQHGLALPLQARARIRLQEGRSRTHQ